MICSQARHFRRTSSFCVVSFFDCFISSVIVSFVKRDITQTEEIFDPCFIGKILFCLKEEALVHRALFSFKGVGTNAPSVS